jgi:hypothetical protein
MRRLVAALCLVLALVVPVASGPAISTDVDTLTSIAEWAGCADVTVHEADILNAYFGVDMMTGLPVILIGTQFPEEHRLTVFLHELGHCLQFMDGSIMEMDIETRELDADGRSAQLACALHMNGPKMVRDLLVWVHETFGYDGDEDHGTLAQRIEQGNRAKGWCPAVQAPLLQT